MASDADVRRCDLCGGLTASSHHLCPRCREIVNRQEEATRMGRQWERARIAEAIAERDAVRAAEARAHRDVLEAELRAIDPQRRPRPARRVPHRGAGAHTLTPSTHNAPITRTGAMA